MTYANVRQRLIAMVQGAAPQTIEHGLGTEFQHDPLAGPDTVLGVRRFMVRWDESLIAHPEETGPERYKTGVRILIGYPDFSRLDVADIVLKEDSQTLIRALRDTSMWALSGGEIVLISDFAANRISRDDGNEQLELSFVVEHLIS